MVRCWWARIQVQSSSKLPRTHARETDWREATEKTTKGKIVSVPSFVPTTVRCTYVVVSQCWRRFRTPGISTHRPAAFECRVCSGVCKPGAYAKATAVPISTYRAHDFPLSTVAQEVAQCFTLNMAISEHVRWPISACCQAAALFMAVAPAAPAAVAFCSSSMSTKGIVNVCTNTSCRKVCLV